MMRRIALVANGEVNNTILVDGKFKPPKGVLAIETETAGIGDKYDGESFIPPEIAKLSKADLIAYAKAAFEAAIRAGIKIDLAGEGEDPQIACIPADASTRADLHALMLVAKIAPNQEFSLVTKDQVFALNSDQISRAHAAVMRLVAASHAALANSIRGIEDGTLASIGDIVGQQSQ